MSSLLENELYGTWAILNTHSGGFKNILTSPKRLYHNSCSMRPDHFVSPALLCSRQRWLSSSRFLLNSFCASRTNSRQHKTTQTDSSTPLWTDRSPGAAKVLQQTSQFFCLFSFVSFTRESFYPMLHRLQECFFTNCLMLTAITCDCIKNDVCVLIFSNHFCMTMKYSCAGKISMSFLGYTCLVCVSKPIRICSRSAVCLNFGHNHRA